jgi:hypothetical protein
LVGGRRRAEEVGGEGMWCEGEREVDEDGGGGVNGFAKKRHKVKGNKKKQDKKRQKMRK